MQIPITNKFHSATCPNCHVKPYIGFTIAVSLAKHYTQRGIHIGFDCICHSCGQTSLVHLTPSKAVADFKASAS